MGLVVWVGYGLWLWWLLVADDGFWFVVGFLVVVDSDLWCVCCGFEFIFFFFRLCGWWLFKVVVVGLIWGGFEMEVVVGFNLGWICSEVVVGYKVVIEIFGFY